MPSAGSTVWLTRISSILRLVSLAILFGGSAAVVFAAITLVKAAQAQGVPTAQAATANAPIFIHFSKVLLGAGIALLISEAIDFTGRSRPGKVVVIRYAASLLCVATTMIFALGIVPPMAELLPLMKGQTAMSGEELERIHASFHRLHEISRIIFGSTILFSLISLVIPTFDSLKASSTPGNALDE